jgi:hypothetical protein
MNYHREDRYDPHFEMVNTMLCQRREEAARCRLATQSQDSRWPSGHPGRSLASSVPAYRTR